MARLLQSWSFNRVLESAARLAQQGVGAGDAALAEAEALAGSDLANPPDVERAFRRDLRVASGRLAIQEGPVRLSVAPRLDPAERAAVGDDVVAARVRDL